VTSILEFDEKDMVSCLLFDCTSTILYESPP